MKRQIRREIFETNSSSTHSLTMCLKSDYDRWNNGEVYLYTGYGYAYPYGCRPQGSHFYTKDECIYFLKSSKFSPDENFDWNNEDEVRTLFRENEFCDSDYRNDSLEWFEDEYTTPSGELVVAFGEYGYDG